MTSTRGTPFLPQWVGFFALLTAVAILAIEHIDGAPIPPRAREGILGTACTHAEIITDCNDDYWCIEVDVGSPPDPTKCPGHQCALACTASTGTYQDPTNPGNQDYQKLTTFWNCGKKYVTSPNCAYYASGSRCKCSTAGAASSIDCQWPKYVFSNCGGT